MDLCGLPILSALCTARDEATAMIAAAPFLLIAHAVGEAAGWFIQALWIVFDQTTLVDVTSPGYVAVYNLIFGIGITVALLLFCFQLITAVVRREPGGLTRAGTGLAKSVLGSFVAVSLVALALEITDQLCIGIVQATGNSMASMGDKIIILVTALTALNAGSPAVGAIVTIFLGGLVIAAGAIVWFSLLVRKSLILLAVALAPLALAGSSWEATKGWASKWLMFVVALIVSKLVLTVILLVAISQISVPIALDIQAITDPLAGIVLLAVAAFAPYITYKAISWLGVDYYHAMSTESEAKQAMNRPVPVPNRLPGDTGSLFGGRGKSGGGGSNGGGGGSPQKTPPSTAPAATSSGAGAGATSGGTTAGTGATTGAAGAAGPIGLGVAAGVEIVKTAATAGPKAGSAVGEQAGGHMDAASTSGQSSTPPPQTPGRVPPPRALPPGPSQSSGGSTPPPASPQK